MPEPRFQNQPFFSGQIIAIIALSSVLGFTFNASNPLGIRFDVKEQKPQANQGHGSAISGASSPSTNPPLPSATAPATMLAKVSNPHSPQNSQDPPASPHAPLQHALAKAPLSPTIPQPATNFSAQVHASSSYKTPTPISWAQVKPILQAEALVLVDARAKGAYDAGHIPGAVSLPESSPPEALMAFQKQHGANAHVVIYCSSVSCSLSSKLAHKLAKDYEFTNVQYMTGGYMEWQRENVLAAGPPNPSLTPQTQPLPTVGPGSATINDYPSPPEPIP